MLLYEMEVLNPPLMLIFAGTVCVVIASFCLIILRRFISKKKPFVYLLSFGVLLWLAAIPATYALSEAIADNSKILSQYDVSIITKPYDALSEKEKQHLVNIFSKELTRADIDEHFQDYKRMYVDYWLHIGNNKRDAVERSFKDKFGT